MMALIKNARTDCINLSVWFSFMKYMFVVIDIYGRKRDNQRYKSYQHRRTEGRGELQLHICS